MKNSFLIIGFFTLVSFAFGQKSIDNPRYFDYPILIDTTNTILIPLRYNLDEMSSKSMPGSSSYYSNILVTKTDSTPAVKLFDKDTYILPFRIGDNNPKYYYSNYYPARNGSTIQSNWVFLFVKNITYCNENKIDSEDPFVMYAMDLHGNYLRALTNKNENVVDFYVYKNQNRVIIKIQRDQNGNRKFTYKDKDFYYLFLDYSTLREIKRVG